MRRALVGGGSSAALGVVGGSRLEALDPLLQALDDLVEVEHDAVLLLDVPLLVGELFLEPADAVVHLRA